MGEETIRIDLTQQVDYCFSVSFGETVPHLVADEPPPLGKGRGPSPVQLLAASVGNCLSSSLLFALRKYKQAPEPMACEVEAEVGRNAEGRLRVTGMKAVVRLGVPAASLQHLERALAQFEAFCTVTQSVSQGFPVTVEVRDAQDARLK